MPDHEASRASFRHMYGSPVWVRDLIRCNAVLNAAEHGFRFTRIVGRYDRDEGAWDVAGDGDDAAIICCG